METYLIYILKSLLLPPGGFVVLMLSAYLIGKKSRVFGNGLLFMAGAGLYFLSLPIFTTKLANLVEKYPPLDISQPINQESQAIIVIGGGMHRDAPEYLSPAVVSHNTLLRLRYTAFLQKQTGLPVLVAGGKVLEQDLPAEADLMTDILENEYLIPVRWQENKSQNTAENAKNSFAILAPENIRRIILITHARHMQRAVEQFSQVGFEVTPAPMAFLSRQQSSNVFDFLPAGWALSLNTGLVYEVLGQCWYQLRYN